MFNYIQRRPLIILSTKPVPLKEVNVNGSQNQNSYSLKYLKEIMTLNLNEKTCILTGANKLTKAKKKNEPPGTPTAKMLIHKSKNKTLTELKIQRLGIHLKLSST